MAARVSRAEVCLTTEIARKSKTNEQLLKGRSTKETRGIFVLFL